MVHNAKPLNEQRLWLFLSCSFSLYRAQLCLRTWYDMMAFLYHSIQGTTFLRSLLRKAFCFSTGGECSRASTCPKRRERTRVQCPRCAPTSKTTSCTSRPGGKWKLFTALRCYCCYPWSPGANTTTTTTTTPTKEGASSILHGLSQSSELLLNISWAPTMQGWAGVVCGK